MEEKIMRKGTGRPLPVVCSDNNIPLISLDNYVVVRREFFSRRRKAAPPRKVEPRKEEGKKE